MGSRGPKSSLIAFVDFAETVHKSLFFRLTQLLEAKGFHLVHVDSFQRGTLGALEHAADSGFAAAVFWGKDVFLDPARFEAVQAKMPCVAVDHVPNGIDADVVMGDHFGGALQVVSHLIELGREQIAISGFLTLVEDSQLRLRGYSQAHMNHRKQVLAHNIVFSAPVINPHEEPRLLSYRLKEEDRPDAIFVLHDVSVPAIASTVLGIGLGVPDDVAIVGFGNDVPFTLGEVGLTTVGLDWLKIAEALADRVVYRIGYPSATIERTVIPAHLIIRGSCGAPKTMWSDEQYQVSSATVTTRMSPTSIPVAPV